MTSEFVIILHTPAEGPQEMQVRDLGEGLFLSLEETDPFFGYRVLCGDRFEADALGDGHYQLRKIVQPYDVLHFEANLGLFMLNPGYKTREQRDEAFRQLGQMMDSNYATEALNDFLRKHRGGWSLFEFVQHFTLYLHVPVGVRELFFEQLPVLCPGLKNTELREIYSGLNADDNS